MTVLSVTHAKVATLPDQPGVEINKGEWNADHAYNWPGGTTNFLREDGTFSNPGSNSGPTFPGGIPLTGVSYPGIGSAGNNLSTGDKDLYTVPTGKRAMLHSMFTFNHSGVGNIVWFPQIKIGGTYYKVNANLTATNGAGSTLATVGYIAEAGEMISVNTATNNGANVFCKIVQFDNTCSLKSSKLTSVSIGDNTVYTAPASTTAILVDSELGITISGTNFFFCNSSISTANIIWYVVASGGSTSTSNQISASTAVNSGSASKLSIGASSLNAGDFIVVNSDTAAAGQLPWVNVMEIT